MYRYVCDHVNVDALLSTHGKKCYLLTKAVLLFSIKFTFFCNIFFFYFTSALLCIRVLHNFFVGAIGRSCSLLILIKFLKRIFSVAGMFTTQHSAKICFELCLMLPNVLTCSFSLHVVFCILTDISMCFHAGSSRCSR